MTAVAPPSETAAPLQTAKPGTTAKPPQKAGTQGDTETPEKPTASADSDAEHEANGQALLDMFRGFLEMIIGKEWAAKLFGEEPKSAAEAQAAATKAAAEAQTAKPGETPATGTTPALQPTQQQNTRPAPAPGSLEETEAMTGLLMDPANKGLKTQAEGIFQKHVSFDNLGGIARSVQIGGLWTNPQAGKDPQVTSKLARAIHDARKADPALNADFENKLGQPLRKIYADRQAPTAEQTMPPDHQQPAAEQPLQQSAGMSRRGGFDAMKMQAAALRTAEEPRAAPAGQVAATQTPAPPPTRQLAAPGAGH